MNDTTVALYDYTFRFVETHDHVEISSISDEVNDVCVLTDLELEALGRVVLTEMDRRGR